MQVHRLLEASADAASKKDMGGALEKAKDAGKKERALCRHRETSGLSDHINLDLTYAVCLNLAYCYHLNHMHDEVRQGQWEKGEMDVSETLCAGRKSLMA